jgi:hypothetical protein
MIRISERREKKTPVSVIRFIIRESISENVQVISLFVCLELVLCYVQTKKNVIAFVVKKKKKPQ